jgi:hypothetical protein
MHDLHHVYHLYADGAWVQPWEEHLVALRSGLQPALSTFGVTLIGSPEQRAVARTVVEQGGASIICEADTGWEQPSLHWIQEHLLESDGAVLYCHSKGAAYGTALHDKWRRVMTYDVVTNWEQAVSLLADVDVVGSWWHFPSERMGPVGYFAGNFWWARVDFLRTLPAPIMEHRFGAEGWLGLNDQVRHHAFREGVFPANIELLPSVG